MLKVTLLGTNGWYDTPLGNTTSALIDTPHFYVVLDAGNGFAKFGQIIKEDKPTYLYISHFHLDHIIGLHTLQLNKFSKGLKIFAQEGAGELLNDILSKPFTTPLANLPFQPEILEVPRDAQLLPFEAQYYLMQHSVPTYGIRLKLENKIIAYTADTAYCDNAVKLAENADLLISECAFKPGETYANSPHVNPQEAAQIAKEAGAKKLLLTHFEARRYPDLQSRKQAETVAREIFAPSYAGVDGMEIEV